MNDDDLLADYDLSAWDAPAPPADLADAVIARATGTALGAASAVEPPRARSRMTWIAAVAAAAVASGAVAIWALRTPSPHRAIVEQADGAASWSISAEEQLAIIAGGGFATIEASGARLRVEVTKMNATDPKVLGTSAATAALVAMITVIVYEGHATVVHDGRTQEVAAGSTLLVGAPPSALPLAPPSAPLPAGGPAVASVDELKVELAQQEAHIALLEAQLAQARAEAAGAPVKVKPPAKTVAPAGCDAQALDDRGKELVVEGRAAEALALFEAAIACKPDPSRIRYAYMAACNAQNADKARMYYRQMPAGTSPAIVQICLRNGITLDDKPEAVASAKGTLKVQSIPATHLLIDGRDTGMDTPASFALVPGKHKVTMRLGEDKFTWTVTIKAGETARIVKDLQAD